LVGALPAWGHDELTAGDRLAGGRKPIGLDHHVGIAAAYDDNLRSVHVSVAPVAVVVLTHLNG
jgi:hypothetical protein